MRKCILKGKKMDNKALNKAILKDEQNKYSTLYYVKFEFLHGYTKYGVTFDGRMIYWNDMEGENPLDITDQITLGDYVGAKSIVEYTTKEDKVILIDDKLVINAKLLKYIDKNNINICYNSYNPKALLNIYEKQIWVGSMLWVGSVFPMYCDALALRDIMDINTAAGKATRKIYK